MDSLSHFYCGMARFRKAGRRKFKAEDRSRSGPNFYKGDDLTKTKLDRKLVGAKYESWETRRRRKKSLLGSLG